MNNVIFRFRALVGVLLCLPLFCVADTATVTVKVTVVTATCVINNGNAIEVDFGEILTTEINGSNYRKPINFTITGCDGGTTKGIWTLKIAGTGASFDTAALQTSVSGLGVRLQNGSSSLQVNKDFDFFEGDQLWSVPVKQSGVKLPGGAFTATATMTLDYW